MTSSGRALLLGSLVLYAAGAVLGYAELAVLATAGVLAVAIAIAWTRTRPQLDVESEFETMRVTVGEPLIGRLRIKNMASRTTRPLVAEEACGHERIRVDIPPLRANEERVVPLPLPTDRRGAFDVGPLALGRADPFELARHGESYGAVQRVWVHPQVLSVLPLPSGRAKDLEGPTSDTAPQGSSAFHALREYVTGDELRHIHWRTTARTGVLMVRHFVDTSRPHSTVVLDTRTSAFAADAFEEAVKIAASIVAASTARRFPVRLATTDGLWLGSDLLSGTESYVFLDRLAEVALSPAGSLTNVATRLQRGRTFGSLAVISGAIGLSDLGVIATLRRRFHSTTMVSIRSDGGTTARVSGLSQIDVSSAEEFSLAWNLGSPR